LAARQALREHRRDMIESNRAALVRAIKRQMGGGWSRILRF
jgi:hypothetical protein